MTDQPQTPNPQDDSQGPAPQGSPATPRGVAPNPNIGIVTPIDPRIIQQLRLTPGFGASRPMMIPLLAAASVAQQQTVQLWQGQYPPPEAIERYERVLPGSFHRMIQMAEQMQVAQIEDGKRAQDFLQKDTRRGHWLGFSLGIFALIGALAALALGNAWVAAAFLAMPVMGVAKSFIDSTRNAPASPPLSVATEPQQAPQPPSPQAPQAPQPPAAE